MKYLPLFLLLGLFFLGCSDDTLEIPSDDYFLSKRLVGTWQFVGGDYWPDKLVLFDDNTFTDTFYTILVNDPIDSVFPIKNINPSIFRNDFSYRGNYKIEDNMLKFNNVILTNGAFLNKENIMVSSLPFFPQREITITNGQLNLNFCYILDPIDNNAKELKGKWGTSSIIIALDKKSFPPFKSGWRREIYEFIPARNICKYQFQYLFDIKPSIVIDSTKYLQLDSRFEFEFGCYEYELKNNQMIWHYYTSTYQKM